MKLPPDISERIILEILDSCEQTLGLKVLRPTLGCGDYGCTFKTDRGSVIKITKSKKELIAANFLQRNPNIHPSLPQIFSVWTWFECHKYDEEIYVIEREELMDLQVDDSHWFNEITGDFDYELYEEWSQRTLDENLLVETMTTLIEAREGTPDDEILLEKILDLYITLLPYDVWLDDTIYLNWGQRPGENIPVVRDLGSILVR